MESEIASINVRSIISKYENLTSKSSPITGAKFIEIKRAKSLGNLIKTKSFSKFIARNFEQIQIELSRLKFDLNNYTNYRKNDHIFYQNRLLSLLIDIVDINDNSDKHELIDQIKESNKLLNFLLPDDSDGVVKIINIPNSTPVADVKIDGNTELMPSFQRLRSLFEQNSVRRDGLQVITTDDEPKMNRYVSYQELSINN